MTIEQINKEIEILIEKKKEELKKIKQKEAEEKRKINAKKRKIQNRVKYIIGGYIMATQPDIIQKLLASDKIREQDKETIKNYLSL